MVSVCTLPVLLRFLAAWSSPDPGREVSFDGQAEKRVAYFEFTALRLMDLVGLSQQERYLFGGPHNKDYSILSGLYCFPVIMATTIQACQKTTVPSVISSDTTGVPQYKLHKQLGTQLL